MPTVTRPRWWPRRTDSGRPASRPVVRTADALLPDTERFERIIQVELMRADRSGTTFCLAAFALGSADGSRPDEECDFAAYLLSRLRATDHAGCLGPRRVGVVLWDTDVSGAETFVTSVIAQCPALLKPTAEIYAYPYPPARAYGPGQRDEDHDSDDAPGPPTCRPVEELLVRELPSWKRAVDLVGATAGLIVLSPLLAATAAAIRLTSPGPALFTQTRDGLGGRPFAICKFRTMYADAEARKAALRTQSEQDGPAFKMANDPRITPLGRYLRKSCVDELPQLWNVLIGDMSLVGPRPLDSREAAGCENWQRRRRWVTPGLTCIWQVDGKSRVPFKEWMRMDLRYMQARSFWQDMKLVFRTATAVVMHKASQ